MTLRNNRKTCPLLARLSVPEVIEAAEQILAHGDARAVAASSPFGASPAEERAVRCAASLLPPRSRALDVAGELARALRCAGVRHDLRLEACHLLPIPASDRSEEQAALFALPEGDSAADWLWELFRVLRVGGRLVADERCLPVAEAMGFRLLSREGGLALFAKSATWPQRGPP